MGGRLTVPRVVVVPQRQLPAIAYSVNRDFTTLAEHIYSLLIMQHFDADWDVRAIVTYLLDSDWLGFAPERMCGCDRCQECNANLRWENLAYELMNEIINNFEPPPKMDYDEEVPVRLIPPSALAVPVKMYTPAMPPYIEGSEIRPAGAPVP